MNIKDQIRAEIERLKDTAWHRADNRYGREDANTYEAWAGAYEKVLEILDTIPEQPTNDFCKENCKGYQETGKCFSDGPCAAKQEASKEQPVEGLLEEVDRFWANEFKYHVNSLPTISVVQRIARHFAEWGAEHLKR